MANLKNITDLPVAESAEGLNLIVNDNGAAKQISADSVGKVKTVNGAQPDENGNVEIEIPEGFSGSWNDLTDKPFHEEEKRTLIVEGVPDEYGRYTSLVVSIEMDKEYIYFIDGIKYTGIGYYDESSGPSVDLKKADGTIVAYISPQTIQLISSQLDLTISHKIEQVEYVVHKLDAKYLPDVGSKSYYISDIASSYIVNEEVYNALLAFYNDPTIGFPNITIKDYSGHLCKAVGIRYVPDEGGRYANLKGFRISYYYVSGSYVGQRIVIALTQNDANAIEGNDMA